MKGISIKKQYFIYYKVYARGVSDAGCMIISLNPYEIDLFSVKKAILDDYCGEDDGCCEYKIVLKQFNAL